ncbi:MAG: hypothetical protein WD426_04340, partial [Anditalea sp.]
MKYLFLASILIFLLTGCKQPSGEEFSTMIDEGDFTVYTTVTDGQLISHFYKTNSPKEVYLLNPKQLKEGYAYHYHENGILIKKSWWENGKKEREELTYDPSGSLMGRHHYKDGVQEGNMYLYENGALKAHQIKKAGKLLYEGLYQREEKYLNKLYPLYVEEFFFEDKYYAKVKFPYDYPGQLDIQVKNIAASIIEQLEDDTF